MSHRQQHASGMQDVPGGLDSIHCTPSHPVCITCCCCVYCTAAAVHEAGGGAAEFNPANPDGSYNLDLAVAADRVVAVQLVELDRAAEKELLRGITVDGKVGGANAGGEAGGDPVLPCCGVHIDMVRLCVPCAAFDQVNMGELFAGSVVFAGDPFCQESQLAQHAAQPRHAVMHLQQRVCAQGESTACDSTKHCTAQRCARLPPCMPVCMHACMLG